MAKKSKLSYWETRSLNQEKAVNDGAKRVEKVVTSAYRQAQSYLTRKVRDMLRRSHQKTGLDAYESKRLLNDWMPVDELAELKRLANDITNPSLKQEAQKRVNSLAFKERISRAEDLKAKAYIVSKQIADVQLDKQTEFYIDTIHDSFREALAEDTIRRLEQNGVTVDTWNKTDTKHEFKELSTRYTKSILDSHWHGSNYSKRLWGDTEALAKRLEELFTVESMTGMSEFEMAKTIAAEFDRSIGVARRLIRTEANYMANQAKLKAWQDRGVKYYMLVAVLDLRTSKICQGKDHKVFLVSEAVVNGVTGNYPPFHPWCRTIAIAYYGADTLNRRRTAINPITGKTMPISFRDTYDDWMKQLKNLYPEERIIKQKKMILNRSKDNIKFREMKQILGRKHPNLPSSLDEYQEIKYNKSDDWRQLQDNLYVKRRLLDGRWGSKLNPEKQAPHMRSTVGKGKSYFEDDTNVQALFDKYAGTGKVELDRAGRRKNTEKIFLDYEVGFEGSTGKKVSGFKIHHSKNRTHIVPMRKE